jgi:hypothetical protein
MRFTLMFILSGLCAYLFGAYLPHWGLMLAIGVLAVAVGGKGTMAFFSAALAVGVVWFLVPFLTMLRTGSGLPEKMTEIMGLGNDLPLFGVTSLIGFLIGGLGALSGNKLRKIFEKKE